MKITKVQTTHVEVPADEPLANGPSEKGAVRKLIATKISTDEGLQGISVAFFGAAITPALKSAIDSLGALAVGMDPQLTEAVHAKFREAGSHAGPGGIFTLASSAIDIALWDIKGKAAGISRHGFAKAAQQLRHRLACGLAFDIPQRDVDGG